MEIMLDTKDEYRQSFTLEDEEEYQVQAPSDVTTSSVRKRDSMGHDGKDRSICSDGTDGNSTREATTSSDSSSVRLAELMELGGKEQDDDDDDYVSKDDKKSSCIVRVQHGEGQQGVNDKLHQKTEEDADDELSGVVSEASPSDNASNGTTATSTGESYSTTEKPTNDWDAKDCFLRVMRFFGFWLLFAGAVVVGIEVVRYASERQEEQLEKENRHGAISDALKTMSLTVLAFSAGQEWPFVTLPEFDLWTNRFSIGARAVTLVVLAEDKDREAWAEYSHDNYPSWTLAANPLQGFVPYVWKNKNSSNRTSLPTFSILNEDAIVQDDWEGFAAISWQSTTPADPQTVNYNYMSSPVLAPVIHRLNVTKQPVQWSTPDMPASAFLMQPITNKKSDMYGYLMAQIPWVSYFTGEMNLNDVDTPGIALVVEDECRGHAAELDLYFGREARLVEPARLNDLMSQSMFGMQAPLNPSTVDENDACASPAVLHVFAFSDFIGSDGNATRRMQPPKLAIATGVFVILSGAICFLLYDFLARRQQAKLAQSAKKSLAIVNALFPATIRDRLLEKEDTTNTHPANNVTPKRSSIGGKKTAHSANKITNRISTVFQSMAESIALGNDSTSEDVLAPGTPTTVPSTMKSLRRRMASKPIADLFPEVTVLFADIAGFTAWSSVREPSQVFTLLESIFECFDAIAKRHNIFKVETIGDCYVAASGLPDPCCDHPVVMCTFARKALQRMGGVVRTLETYLGPGTADLSMRIGIHSGPIMAGVLRGEKTRFQLFGDTMNTAARIESSGEKDRIHLSQETAELLIKAGKKDWVEARETLVTAKGKGELQTYWLATSTKSNSSSGTASQGSSGNPADSGKPSSIPDMIDSTPVMYRQINTPTSENGEPRDPKGKQSVPLAQSSLQKEQTDRLVDFNTQVLERYLKKMVAMRQEKASYISPMSEDEKESKLVPTGISTAGSVFDEVHESISLPTEPAKYLQNPDRVVLSPLVKHQLREYVTSIASMYRDVPFHCFDHASHVVMSVTKLLARVVTPETIDYTDMRYKIKAGSTALHEYTYGITSDALTQFAVAFAALIHDVDHTGVPNAQLVKEGIGLAQKYDKKSVAEQHSIHLAWELLMGDNFKELRSCIYTSQAELDRFRSLLVNAVMATDIADKSLTELRRRRWEKVFGMDELEATAGDQESMNRKATIVIEHLIQASDVAHTMQHWHVYLRWNKRLFKECYLAYHSGRGDTNPLESWYQGELGFYDHYIIPLAKKLKECGVFGVASDEYLHNAMQNRSEWAAKGKKIVNGYREDFVASLKGTHRSANKGRECKDLLLPPPSPPRPCGKTKRQASTTMKGLQSTKRFTPWGEN